MVRKYSLADLRVIIMRQVVIYPGEADYWGRHTSVCGDGGGKP